MLLNRVALDGPDVLAKRTEERAIVQMRHRVVSHHETQSRRKVAVLAAEQIPRVSRRSGDLRFGLRRFRRRQQMRKLEFLRRGQGHVAKRSLDARHGCLVVMLGLHDDSRVPGTKTANICRNVHVVGVLLSRETMVCVMFVNWV